MNDLVEIFGTKLIYECKQWGGVEKLPLYLKNGYKFQKAEIDSHKCLMMEPKGKLPTLPALKKQIARIQQIENIPVVICLDSMSAFRRKNMIESRIPFVVENKQIYLPFLGAFFIVKANEQEVAIEQFKISTWLLFILYINNEGKELYLSDATQRLPYSAMTISRAAKQLEASKLFRTRKDGVNKILFSKLCKKELYKELDGYFTTLIIKTYYLPKKAVTDDMVLAGVSALSEQSMLSESNLMHYAVEQGSVSREGRETELLDEREQVLIEEWSYDPQLFAKEGIADPISIAFSLAYDQDERVQMAVEEMLNALWEKIDD